MMMASDNTDINEETESLVSATSGVNGVNSPTATNSINKPKVVTRRYSRLKKSLIVLSIVLLLATIVLLHQDLLFGQQTNSKVHDSSIQLSCPNEIEKSTNDKNEVLVEWYDKQRGQAKENYSDKSSPNEGDKRRQEQSDDDRIVSIYPTNMTDKDIESMLNSTYDASTWTYNEFKITMFDFKQRYGRLLKSGDSIFEVRTKRKVVSKLFTYITFLIDGEHHSME